MSDNGNVRCCNSLPAVVCREEWAHQLHLLEAALFVRHPIPPLPLTAPPLSPTLTARATETTAIKSTSHTHPQVVMVNWVAQACWSPDGNASATFCDTAAGNGGLSIFEYNSKTSQYAETFRAPVVLDLTCERRCGGGGGLGGRGSGRSAWPRRSDGVEMASQTDTNTNSTSNSQTHADARRRTKIHRQRLARLQRHHRRRRALRFAERRRQGRRLVRALGARRCRHHHREEGRRVEVARGGVCRDGAARHLQRREWRPCSSLQLPWCFLGACWLSLTLPLPVGRLPHPAPAAPFHTQQQNRRLIQRIPNDPEPALIAGVFLSGDGATLAAVGTGPSRVPLIGARPLVGFWRWQPASARTNTPLYKKLCTYEEYGWGDLMTMSGLDGAPTARARTGRRRVAGSLPAGLAAAHAPLPCSCAGLRTLGPASPLRFRLPSTCPPLLLPTAPRQSRRAPATA